MEPEPHCTPASWLDAPSRWAVLDRPAQRIAETVRRLPLGRARSVLHGDPLGHPLHPSLAQVPIGCWLAASLLDATGGEYRAARRLTAAGLAVLPPVLLAGWVDWSQLSPVQRRTGLVHAASAVTGAAFQACSLRARRNGHPLRGRLLGLAGTGVVGMAGALGGHLAFRRTAGAVTDYSVSASDGADAEAGSGVSANGRQARPGPEG